MADNIQETSTRALTNVDLTFSKISCTMGSGQLNNNTTADFRVVIEPAADKQSYTLQVYTRLTANYEFMWTGDGTLKVNVKWTGTNGTTQTYAMSMQTQTPLNVSGNQTPYTTPWNGPLTFRGIPAKGASSLNVDIDLDLLRTACAICSDQGNIKYEGPGNTSIYSEIDPGYDHDHYQHYYLNKDISVAAIPLESAPIISNLTNNNKYNSNNGISASTNSISIKWDSNGDAITSSRYRLNGGEWVNSTSLTSATITNLTAGTSYKVEVQSLNGAGSSDILSITVRTKHNIPIVTLDLQNRELNRLIFKWSSNKQLSYIKYELGDGNFATLDVSGTSGTIVVSPLEPKQTVNITIVGIASSTYDSLSSSEVKSSGTTYDIGRITSIGNCIFGESIDINIQSESDEDLQLRIDVDENSSQYDYMVNMPVSKGTFKFTPTQQQLDGFYKCFTNRNYINLLFTLYTNNGTKSWADTAMQKQLTLTGIAKTARVGVNGEPRRSQVWVSINGTPRRAIMWIGDENNKPRRCM